jgi:hypothetical protein
VKTLDDLLAKLESLYIPLYVKGKLYPGNNPYVLNEINNMLEAGAMKKRHGELSESIETLEISDLRWEDKRLVYDNGYLYCEELNMICEEIEGEVGRLLDEDYKRKADKA